MNILLINHYAGSSEMGMEYRPYYLAKEWIKKGHKVKIIASSFSHLRTKQPIVNKSYTEQNIDGIDYFWIKTPIYKGNTSKRFINMLVFIYKLSIKISYFAKQFKPDVVISSSTYPLDIFPAQKIASKSKAKLIFEIHDLWPLSPMELGGYSKNHPFIKIMQIAENYAYKNCDILISMLPKTLEHTIEHGLKPEKWNYIPNGINLEEWNKDYDIPLDYKNILSDLKNEGYFLVGYIGTHGLANALEYLIDAAKLLENHKISIILVGKGNEKENLMQKAKNIKNVVFLDFVTKKTIPVLLNFFDILYIGWNKNPLYRFGISPNKIFDYMMSQKPIIHSVKASNDFISEAKCGISVEPESPEKIANAILEMSKFSEKELFEMGQRGKSFVLKNHEYSVLADKFLKIIS